MLKFVSISDGTLINKQLHKYKAKFSKRYRKIPFPSPVDLHNNESHNDHFNVKFIQSRHSRLNKYDIIHRKFRTFPKYRWQNSTFHIINLIGSAKSLWKMFHYYPYHYLQRNSTSSLLNNILQRHDSTKYARVKASTRICLCLCKLTCVLSYILV